MKILSHLATLSAAAVLLLSCTSGVSRPPTEPKDRLLELRQSLERDLAGLHRVDDPVRGRARIVVPDHDRLRPMARQYLYARFRRDPPDSVVGLMADNMRLMITACADALLKSHAFESAAIFERNDTLHADMGDADYLVWLEVAKQPTGIWTAHWKVRRSGGEDTEDARVDEGTAEGAPRYDSFVSSVREAAMRLGGTTVVGSAALATSDTGSDAVLASGSGMITDSEGHVLTTFHVVRRCRTLRVVDAQGHAFPATLAARSITDDLAMLKSSIEGRGTAMFRDSRGLRQGDAVVVAGYPLKGLVGSGMSATTGSVSALSGPRDDMRFLQVTAPVQPGNSGGPVLDMSGSVIGVVTMSLSGMRFANVSGIIPQNVNFATKARVARSFLEMNDLDFKAAAPRTDGSAADIAALARDFTVQIECLK